MYVCDSVLAENAEDHLEDDDPRAGKRTFNRSYRSWTLFLNNHHLRQQRGTLGLPRLPPSPKHPKTSYQITHHPNLLNGPARRSRQKEGEARESLTLPFPKGTHRQRTPNSRAPLARGPL